MVRLSPFRELFTNVLLVWFGLEYTKGRVVLASCSKVRCNPTVWYHKLESVQRED